MSQCPAQAEDKTEFWRCLVDEGHVGEHQFDAEYYRQYIADLEAENARLQERVEEAEAASKGRKAWDWDDINDALSERNQAREEQEAAEQERDRYKALAERRGEALTLLKKAKWSLSLLFGLRYFGASTTTSEHIERIWGGAKASAEDIIAFLAVEEPITK